MYMLGQLELQPLLDLTKYICKPSRLNVAYNPVRLLSTNALILDKHTELVHLINNM